jgi:exonuclease III
VPDFNAFCLNVNGINKLNKRNELNSMRKLYDWSIVLLADTRVHCDKELSIINQSFECKDSVWSFGTPHVGGTTILFFKPMVITLKYAHPENFFTRADVLWEGEAFSLMSLYAPAEPTRRKIFISNVLVPYLQRNPLKEKGFLEGNFNFVENPLIDRTSASQGSTLGCQEWKEVSEDLGLKDAFRNFHPRKRSYTFRSAAHKMQTRIDRWYTSELALPFVSRCQHIPLTLAVSDHQAGVEASLRAVNSAQRGPSFWQLNVSLMKRPDFAKLAKSVIADFQASQDGYPDLSSWWKMLKLALQIHLKRYSQQQLTRRKKTILTIESQILQVNYQLACGPEDPALLQSKVRLDQLLADYYDDICEAARVKSGLRHRLEGERLTKYFTSLMKQRAEKSAVTSLLDKNDVVLTHIEDILEKVSDFYATLYSNKVSVTDRNASLPYLCHNVSAYLSSEEKLLCDQSLTVDELGAAL